MAKIHPTAVIEDGAQIAASAENLCSSVTTTSLRQ